MTSFDQKIKQEFNPCYHKPQKIVILTCVQFCIDCKGSEFAAVKT